MADVFISYHRSEGTSALVRRIARELESMGISCWYDTKDPAPGRFADTIEKEIGRCKAFLFIWDDGANQSPWCLDEVTSARDHKKLPIPFKLGRFEETPELSLRLRGFNAIDGNHPTAVQTLVKQISVTLGKPEAKQKTKAPKKKAKSKFKARPFKLDNIIWLLILFSLIATLAFAMFSYVYHPFWDFENGILTIRNTGDMDNYTSSSRAPWAKYSDKIIFVNILDGVTSIGNCAFADCDNLKSVTIPHGITKIGSSAFARCKNLTGVIIPDGVEAIGGYAFSDCVNLTGVRIPDSVENISGYAFHNCANLTAVAIPDNVTNIEYSVFSGCESLTDITVKESHSAYTTKDGVLFDKDVSTLICYPAGKKSETYSIPDSVSSIGNSAFLGCVNLTGISIPESVTSIRNQAFKDCAGLTDIVIPENMTFISYGLCSGCSNLTGVTIPDGVTSIEGYSFYNCASLSNVTIPDSVTTIEYDAFYGCTALKSIVIPDSVHYIGDYAFYGCTSLTNVVIPDSVTHIEYAAFYECSNLTSVSIPKNAHLGWWAFDNRTEVTRRE